MSESGKDRLYVGQSGAVDRFEFNDGVASVFEDMIKRSVPGYAMTLSMMSLIAQRYVQPNTNVYDLGCSLGAGILAMNQELETPATFIGIDNSGSMLARCRKNLDGRMGSNPLVLKEEDVRDCGIENASLVILNFTLQFIPPSDRLKLLSTIYEGLLPGGVLLLSEKIHFEDDSTQQALFDLHHDFKRQQGYSDLEISQKRNALEKVLITETLSTHKRRLNDAGFRASETWFQCFNFVSLIALK